MTPHETTPAPTSSSVWCVCSVWHFCSCCKHRLYHPELTDNNSWKCQRMGTQTQTGQQAEMTSSHFLSEAGAISCYTLTCPNLHNFCTKWCSFTHYSILYSSNVHFFDHTHYLMNIIILLSCKQTPVIIIHYFRLFILFYFKSLKSMHTYACWLSSYYF